MCSVERITYLRQEIKRLRAELREELERKRKETGALWPTGLDYVKMVRVEELHEEIERLENAS